MSLEKENCDFCYILDLKFIKSANYIWTNKVSDNNNIDKDVLSSGIIILIPVVKCKKPYYNTLLYPTYM